MILPYQPSELSQEDVDLLQELLLSKRLFPATQDNASYKIRFIKESTLGSDQTFSCLLGVDQQQLSLTLEPTIHDPLIQRLQELGGLESLPEEFREICVALYARHVINALETLFQLPIVLLDNTLEKQESSSQKTLFFELVTDHLVIEARGQITVPFSLIKKIIFSAKQLPVVEDALLAHTLVEGELVIDRIKLSSAQWKRLTAGSLLVLNELSALVTGHGYFLMKNGDMIPIMMPPEELKKVLLSLEEVTSIHFSHDHLQPATPEEALEDSMMLELALSVGTLSLSIDQIITLSHTKKLVNNIVATRPIKIFIQGILVGTGELIALNKQHALFITQLSSSYVD